MLRARKHITKKEIKHDAMLESIFKIETFIKGNSKLVLYGTVAIVAIIVISIMMLNSKREAEVSAATAVGIAQFKLLSGDFQDAVVRLEDATKKYPGTAAIKKGIFYLANANYQLGNINEAEKYFLEFINNDPDDPLLESSSYSGIGSIKEDARDYAGAAIYYQNAASATESNYQIDNFILLAIRNHHKAGNSEVAKELVEDLLGRKELSTEFKIKVDHWKSKLDVEAG